MNKKKRVEIFTRLAEKTPNPTTELIYTSNFELLIAVMLSAQATDTSVNKVTTRLFKMANTPKSMSSLGVSGLPKKLKVSVSTEPKRRMLLQHASY